MTTPSAPSPTPPAAARRRSAPWLGVLAVVALAAVAVVQWRQGERIAEQSAQLAASQDKLERILGEVTRLRIEQSAEHKGPLGLLEKLRTYAPLLANSRTTEPDYRNALAEMESIVLAMRAAGRDAWAPIQERLAQLDPKTGFDEIKWLLRAAAAIDPKATTEILKEVLLGRRLPSPRLRWFAADELTRLDRPLAQATLRHVLNTESSRGVNVDRANGAMLPDTAALASNGFNNFVVKYVATDDPKLEETLLMLIGRVEHDQITLQECVEELGRRRCERAAEPIEKLFRNPPPPQQNPIFLVRCLDAIYAIRGKEGARPLLEEAIKNGASEAVARHAQSLLNAQG